MGKEEISDVAKVTETVTEAEVQCSKAGKSLNTMIGIMLRLSCKNEAEEFEGVITCTILLNFFL